MEITNATFEAPLQGTDPRFVLRVRVHATNIAWRAAPVIASVGPVIVEAIGINLDGSGFVGLLRVLPPTGSKLKVGYMDGPLTETDFTYDPAIV